MLDIELILVDLFLYLFLDLIDTTVVLALQFCVPLIVRVIPEETFLSWSENLPDFFQSHP